jgi:hypothetical protein
MRMAPQNKILAGFSKRDAGAAIYISVSGGAAFSLCGVQGSRTSTNPWRLDWMTKHEHALSRQDADGVPVTVITVMPTETPEERERLLNQLRPEDRELILSCMRSYPKFTAAKAIEFLTAFGGL